MKRLGNIVLQVHVEMSCDDAAGAREARESTESSFFFCLLPPAFKLLEKETGGTFRGVLSF